MSKTLKIMANASALCDPRDHELRDAEFLANLWASFDEAFDGEPYIPLGGKLAVWGDKDPSAIKSLASEWNRLIQKDLTTTIREYLLTLELKKAEKWLANKDTKDLVSSAKAANNEVSCYANRLLFGMQGESGFSSLLTKQQLDYILDHPDEYAICELQID